MILGIDIGSSSIKASLVSPKGIHSCTHVQLPVIKAGGRTEYDPVVFRQRVASAISGFAKSKLAEVQAIGVCGYGNGLIALDDADNPVRRFISSSDQRAAITLQELESEGGKDWFRSRNRQTLYPGQLPILLRWIKENEPGTYHRIRKVMLAKDYLRWLLTGDWHSDFSDMGATGLLKAKSTGYDPELLEAYGIEDIRPALPELFPSETSLSRTSTDFAASLNIKPETPVATGCIDAEATSIGCGIRGPGSLSIVAGTWSINQCIVPELPDSAEFFLSTYSARENYFWILEGSATSANNFEWYVRTLCDATGNKGTGEESDPFTQQCHIASQSEMRVDLPIFLPFLQAEDSGACFVGLRPYHSNKDLTRAVLEGIIMGHRYHVEKLRRAGLQFQEAYLAGGLSKSSFVCQTFSDILNLPLHASSEVEAGPLGAAILAGVSTGYWPSIPDAQAALCTTQQHFLPDPEKRSTCDRKYARYLQLACRITENADYNYTLHQQS